MATYPNRLRLHGGRNTHAARPVSGDLDNLVTACGYLAGPKDQRRDDSEPVNCRNCQRETTKEQQ